MARLADVSVDELEDALAEATGKRETQRLLAAIIYKRGPSVPMIAEWFGTREATIYRWFDRLEDRPIQEAIRDDPRPGRPPKLADDERERFEAALQEPPEAAGYDEPAWTPKLAQRFLRDAFDAEYTRRHVRRLLTEAGHSR
ncbi:MAG TPA: helix-turn-helix domain-containing protein [Halobacteriales archaeon]|nr:helix-turn-helix domain-containing protein [Halobacteriales archaeon]